jgi:hypothetical protein
VITKDIRWKKALAGGTRLFAKLREFSSPIQLNAAGLEHRRGPPGLCCPRVSNYCCKRRVCYTQCTDWYEDKRFWALSHIPEKLLLASSFLSLRPSASNNSAPNGGVFINSIFQCFSKICPKFSSLIKIWPKQSVLYIKTKIHFWSYIAQLFLEWQMFQTYFVEETKTQIICSITFFENSVVYEIMWKIF